MVQGPDGAPTAFVKVETPLLLGIHSTAVPLAADKWRHVNTVLKA